jgi:hypothetical protein
MTSVWLPVGLRFGRHETGLSLRQNALDPGFHGVLPGPAEPDVMLMVPA